MWLNGIMLKLSNISTGEHKCQMKMFDEHNVWSSSMDIMGRLQHNTTF